MNRIAVRLLITLLTLPTALLAAVGTPFSTSNQNPLVSVYGLPSADSATVLTAGETGIELRSDISSSCSASSNADEYILLDGETSRYQLALKRGIGRNLEIGIEIPYISHSGGNLDSLINSWHNSFNFPEGERAHREEDQLNYDYSNNDESEVGLSDNAEGFGDIRLTTGWQFIDARGNPVTLRISLKLPTGDADELTGSGSSDLAVWISAAKNDKTRKLAVFSSLGGMLMTEGDLLPELQNNIVAFATLGGGWQPWQRLGLKVQLDAHSAFYASPLRELGESVQLALGGSIQLSGTTSLDLAIVEDLLVDSAPDVAFHIALKTRL
jgi:hypothetical protein